MTRATWIREGRGVLAAVTFLTRAPAGAGSVVLDADDVRRAALSFPIVGVAVGAATGALAARLAPRCSPSLAASLAVAGETLMTGALHLDALADTADALGTRSRERALEVLRDSTIGAFGATAVGLGLAIKVLALSELARRGSARRSAAAAGAVSRAVPVALAAGLPYARDGDGTGVALARGGAERAAGAVVLALVIAIAADGADGAALAGLAGVLCAGFAAWYRRWLGGVTGDALGAALELTETAVLVAAVALRPITP